MARGARWIVLLIGLLVCAPLADSDPAPPVRTGIRYLYLVRHGDYARDSVRDDRIQGPLTRLGHEQARLAGKWLKRLPVRFTSLITSDFLRARETAADIGAVMGLSPAIDSLIHECAPPSFRDESMKNRNAEEAAACESSLTAAWSRYVIPSPDADAHQIFVCHGNVIRWFVCRTLSADTHRWPAMEIGNASVTIVSVRPDGTTRLVMFSGIAHLPLEKQTWTGRGAGWKPPSPRPAMR